MDSPASQAPGELWVNIDKKVRTLVLHVSRGCSDVRDRGSGDFKPVGIIGRDGGWLAANDVPQAIQIARSHGGPLTYCSNCAKKEPAFIPFLGGQVEPAAKKAKPTAATQVPRQFFWVNQGATFHEERELGIIWAPKRDIAGKSQPHWVRLLQVREGDVVFHYANQKLQAASVALASGQGVPTKPISSSAWKDGAGYQVELAYERAPTPITKQELVAKQFFQQLAPHLVNSAGSVNQTYLEPLSEKAGMLLLAMLDIGFSSQSPTSPAAVQLPDTPTERERLVQARIGQGKFREDVLAAWEERCPATGISHPKLLRASHIKRWADSSNKERLDPFNGITLAAHIDAAFDAGLISFADDGSVLAASSLTSEDQLRLQLQSLAKLTFSAQHLPYLAAHRQRHAFG